MQALVGRFLCSRMIQRPQFVQQSRARKLQHVGCECLVAVSPCQRLLKDRPFKLPQGLRIIHAAVRYTAGRDPDRGCICDKLRSAYRKI